MSFLINVVRGDAKTYFLSLVPHKIFRAHTLLKLFVPFSWMGAALAFSFGIHIRELLSAGTSFLS